MSISSVASTPPSVSPNPRANAVRQNFSQLAQAIQTGDLSDAQAAYSTLLQSLPGQNGGNSGSNNPFQQAISSIGSALQSGDIAGAQQALQTMQTQMKGHHHHHQPPSGQAADDSNTNASPPPSALPPTASMSFYA